VNFRTNLGYAETAALEILFQWRNLLLRKCDFLSIITSSPILDYKSLSN